jgi:hypothetical protein
MIRKILGLGPSQSAMDGAFQVLQKIYDLQLIQQNLFERANLAVHRKNQIVVDLVNNIDFQVKMIQVYKKKLNEAKDNQDKSSMSYYEDQLQTYREKIKVFLTKLQLNLNR